MNKAVFIGRVIENLELKQTQNSNVCNIKMAVQDGEKDSTFITITTYGKIAENCAKYLEKGCTIASMCKVKNNNYTDKNGNKIYTYKFIAEKVTFISRAKHSTDVESLPFE